MRRSLIQILATCFTLTSLMSSGLNVFYGLRPEAFFELPEVEA